MVNKPDTPVRPKGDGYDLRVRRHTTRPALGRNVWTLGRTRKQSTSDSKWTLGRLGRLGRRSSTKTLATCKTKKNKYSHLNLEDSLLEVRPNDLNDLNDLSA